MIIFSLFLLPSIVLALIGIACTLEQRYFLGSRKTVSHHKLNGHQIKTVKGSTLLSCGQSCLAEPRCVSTNFGVSEDNERVCELNDGGISLSSGSDARELTYAKGFIFSLYSSVFQISTDMKVRISYFTKEVKQVLQSHHLEFLSCTFIAFSFFLSLSFAYF